MHDEVFTEIKQNFNKVISIYVVIIQAAAVLTDFIFPVDRISSRTEAKNFNAIPPLVTSGFP